MSRYFLPGSSVLSFMSLSTIFQSCVKRCLNACTVNFTTWWVVLNINGMTNSVSLDQTAPWQKQSDLSLHLFLKALVPKSLRLLWDLSVTENVRSQTHCSGGLVSTRLLSGHRFTLKAPPIICSRQQFQILLFCMIFHENLLLADDSHEISYLIFVEN